MSFKQPFNTQKLYSQFRPVQRPIQRPVPIQKILPPINSYAPRVKDGASSLLLPPVGIVVGGKRKRAAAAASANAITDSLWGDDDESDENNDSDRKTQKPPDSNSLVKPPPPIRKLRKTKHDYSFTFIRDQAISTPELLVPIRIDLDVDGFKLSDAFMWNLRERQFTPKKFAEIMCEDLDIPHSSYAGLIEASIKSQIEDYIQLMAHQIDVIFNVYHVIDRIEWDLTSSLTPEEFSLQMAADLGLSSEFAVLVSHSIHEAIIRAKLIVSASAASSSTSAPSFSILEDVEEVNSVLDMVKNVKSLACGIRGGREFDIEEFGPSVQILNREGVDKILAEREKEKQRRQKFNTRANSNRRRSSFFQSDVDAQLAVYNMLGEGEISKTIDSLEICLALIRQLALFSSNESLDEISTVDLKFLACEHYLAILTGLQTGKREPLIKSSLVLFILSKAHHESFLSKCETYNLLEDSDRIFMGRGGDRETKIKRYKQIKEIRETIKALEKSPESSRDYELAILRACMYDSIDDMRSLKEEIKLLEEWAVRDGPDVEKLPAHTSDSYSERLDILKPNALMDSKGKPLQPFMITNRNDIKKGVFRSGHNLPTLSIDDYLESERQKGNFLSGGGPSSKEVKDEEEDDDVQRAKDISWDAFKDDNPRGWGNRYNKG